ncbi:MAG TPA: mechanosensitive ion channel family protein [Steroidobacteraceae bacterium]
MRLATLVLAALPLLSAEAQQSPGPAAGGAVQISNVTVAGTADLQADFGYGPFVELVAGKLPQVSILGVELYKWVLALTGGLVAYTALFAASRLIARFWTPHRALSRGRLVRYLCGPVSLVVTALVIDALLHELGLGAAARRIAEGRTVIILLATWLTLATLSLVRDALTTSLQQRGRGAAVVLQRPLFAAVKIVVVIIAALTWLNNLGYNVSTLLASLGVGGVAVALALQKPLEDVFGAITLYNQQPIRVGDFCRFGDKVGTVEDIGLRTTRVRTPANTIIAVPNAKLAGEYLENFSARRKILYNPTLRLRYDTPPEILHRVLGDIRELLTSHAKVVEDGPRVRFVRIGADALEIEIFANLDTTLWPQYLELIEELNIRMLQIIAAAGARLALPAQNLVVEQPAAAGTQPGRHLETR